MPKTITQAPIFVKRTALFALFYFFIFFSFAQQISISGKVISESGTPLFGVSVQLKDGSETVQSTSTKEDGSFSIVGGGNLSLTFTYVGFEPQTIQVNNRTVINVVMTSISQDLDDVIISVGYGTIRKSDMTGAVGVVKGADLAERPAASLNQALSGKVTGMNVSTNSGRPGGRAQIRIRGNTSVSVSNNPLYVIDGVILNSSGLANGSTPIDYINPGDIASIEVLKDASATAIYGARGANGVILVTTKRGGSAGGGVNYDSDFSIGTLPRQLDLLNSREFLEVEDIAYINAEKYDPVGFAAGKYVDPKTKRNNPLLFDAQGNPLYDTNWQDESFQNAITQNHQLSITGGNEDGSYGAFLNYRNENGLVQESWLKRYAGRFVFDSKVKEWLKVGGSLSYNDQDESQIDPLGGGGIIAMRQVLEALPIIPVKYSDGRWAGNEDYPGMEGGGNPVHVINERLYFLKTQTLLGNMYASLQLADGLEFRTTVGTNIINQRNDYYGGRDLNYISRNQKGVASVANSRYNSWQFENYLTYLKRVDVHSINALLGLSWQHIDQFNATANTQNFQDDFFGFNNLGAGSNPQSPSSNRSAYGLNSYFTRLNYVLKDKYLFTFTGRADGSSKFGAGNQFAFFPSAALAWKVSDEAFMNSVESVSNLRLRASYGVTGNSEISAYQALAGMGNYSMIFGGERAIGIGINRLPNPELKWEKTHQMDAGLELGLFQNRLSVEFDIYRKKTTDMLLNAPVPASSGYQTVSRNIGSMENQGVEFALHTLNVKADYFSWSSIFNISINKNKVLSLTGGNDIFSGRTVIREGEPLGSFFGYVHQGTWGTAEAEEAAKYFKKPGDIKYADLNNDGKLNDADRTIIGQGIGKGFGTFMNTFSYKNFELLVDLQFMYGNDVMYGSLHSAEDRVGIANSFKTVLNAWTPENQNTPIAELRPVSAGYTTNDDSHRVKDGSFIRGRNLLLGYTFPSATTNRLNLSRLRLFTSVQNFFLSTKYEGYDPEVQTSGNPFDQGVALYDYPKPRVFMLGVNIGL